LCFYGFSPLFFGWKNAWRNGVGHKKKMKGREARDREFLSFLCCDIFVYGEKWQDKERHKKIMCNFS
jgi:hypothetical protein